MMQCTIKKSNFISTNNRYETLNSIFVALSNFYKRKMLFCSRNLKTKTILIKIKVMNWATLENQYCISYKSLYFMQFSRNLYIGYNKHKETNRYITIQIINKLLTNIINLQPSTHNSYNLTLLCSLPQDWTSVELYIVLQNQLIQPNLENQDILSSVYDIRILSLKNLCLISV